MDNISKHKVFISYHHANDEGYKKEFVKLFSEILDGFIDNSVWDGDIDDTNLSAEQIYKKIRDDYIKDSTVTIVLIGEETWKRKHIDWEIATSLVNGSVNKRNGLIGILLPSRDDYNTGKFSPCTIPPRLYDNVKNGYAKIYDWSYDVNFIKKIIDEAFNRRFKKKADNSRDRFKHNKKDNLESWC
jgi:hypothetical protein